MARLCQVSGQRGRWRRHFASRRTYVGRNSDVEVADDTCIVRGDGVGQGSRLHEVVIRCVQQPVQDVAFVMGGPTDGLGQTESG